MDKGRKICDVLKAVRKKIADMNGITYEPRICHYKGHCSGTCPACEAERKYLENELSLRKRMGEAVCITGVAIGILAAPYNACAHNSSYAAPANKEVIASDSLSSKKEQVTVRGCVKEADGTPLIGAIIGIGKKKRGVTITDVDGNFSLNISQDKNIWIRFIGYKDKVYSFNDLDLKGFNILCLTEEDESILGEMPVAGMMSSETKAKRHKKQKQEKATEKKKLDLDTEPAYPGGDKEMKIFVAKNLCMPETLLGAYQQRIFVSCYVLGDGSLADVKVVTDCPPEMKEEILRLVKKMPKWHPAMKDGKPTCAKTTIRIDVREM